MGKLTTIQPLSWVRLKRFGKYRDDLGFVHSVDPQSSVVSVYVVPRIKLDRKRKRKNQGNRRSRPPAALFNAVTVADYYGDEEIVSINYLFRFQKDVYTFEGLLEGEYSPWDVSVVNVNPTQAELELFRASGHELVLDALRAGVVPLQIGDRVQVVIGTFTGLTGRLVDIKSDSTVIFQTEDAARHEVYSSEIRKFFSLGDYVAILHGDFNGRRGYIIQLGHKSALIYEHAATAGEEVCSDTYR